MVTMVHAEGKILTFQPSRLPEKGFLAFKREANSSCKNIQMKLTLLKKVSKVVHFRECFLHECSMYCHFDFKLKK